MKKIMSAMIWTQIILQALLPVSSLAGTREPPDNTAYAPAASPFSVDRQNTGSVGNTDNTLPWSDALSQGAHMLASGHASDSVRSLATGTASGELQQWLSRFGTARIQLNLDRHGGWSHSSGDLLIPVYDSQKSLLFVQGGIRKPSDRLTGNLGVGIRTFWQNGWMYGGNVFYDNDFTGNNRRVGIGGEAWQDYLRLSANIYAGTTQWHTSRDFDDTWQEKPADGYDVRAEGWLPAYPQLGAKVEWEQYYGSQVALFDKDHLQHNPHALTAGVEYTPVPLITLGVDQKLGRGEHDTQVALGVHWSTGHDWRWQIDPANVQAMRTLAGSRYDLVNRNNEIVLQYRKKSEQGVAHLALTVVTDNSPADGVTRNILQVLATNRDGQPVRSAPVSWQAPSDGSASLTVPSSVTDDSGLATVTLTSTKAQTVPVTAQSGPASAMQNSHFVPVAVSKIALSVTHDNAVADGSSPDTVVATLTDSNGRAVAGQTVTWTVPNGVTVSERSSTSDASGKASVNITSATAGRAVIRAAAGSLSADGTVHFTGDAASARINALTVTTDGSPANGKTPDVARVTVTDANGNPLAGQALTWKADKRTVTFGQSTATDAAGRTTVTYTDTVAESLTLTAALANGGSASTPSLFVSDKDSARLKDLAVTSGAKADGSATNTATVTVTDANGNLLRNAAVTFSITGSAKLSQASVSTGSDGKAQVTFTDTAAEAVKVTAKLATGSSMTKDSSFAVDLDSAVLTVTAMTGALADGNATNTATVSLKDKNGMALPGQVVTLAASGSAKLSAVSGTTDGNGQVVVTLTDTVAETVTVTASLSNGKQATAQPAFIGYAVTALTASTASVKTSGQATLTATVKDSSGRVVANAPVTFSVTGSAELSSSTVTTGASGQAQVILTDGTGEKVTVTAKAQNSRTDAGNTASVTFVASAITGITVSNTGPGYTRAFSADSGFPETGFAGAAFTLSIDNGDTPASDYTWRSSQPWASVSNGKVTFTGTPAAGTKSVTITATPESGRGTLTWSFTLQHWFTLASGIKGVSAADSYCSGIGQSVPSRYLLDYKDYGTTKVGSLWSEWADSIPRKVTGGGNDVVWAAETGNPSRYYMMLRDGHIYDNGKNAESDGMSGDYSWGAACVADL